MEIDFDSVKGLRNVADRLPERAAIKLPDAERDLPNNREFLKSMEISKGENEIKSLLKSGFVIKNDENLLFETYGHIDKNVRNSFNAIFLKEGFVEIQGAAFSSMTPYGRNVTVKNIIMSSSKFEGLNDAGRSRGRTAIDEKFKSDFKLSDITLKNYFELKKNGVAVNPEDSSPGSISISSADGRGRKAGYSIKEAPSAYKYSISAGSRDAQSGLGPDLGIFKEYKNTVDGFKNIKVNVDGQKVIEMESIHNWQKITDYVKARDMRFLRELNDESGKEMLSRIEVHHINQLQDGGKDNVNNLMAIGSETHRLADACKIPLDKNTAAYRELFYGKVYLKKQEQEHELPFQNNANDANNFDCKIFANGTMPDINTKILSSEARTCVESHSSMKLKILKDEPENLKMLFLDMKTSEELRILVRKNMDGTEKDVSMAALLNFVKDLSTGR